MKFKNFLATYNKKKSALSCSFGKNYKNQIVIKNSPALWAEGLQSCLSWTVTQNRPQVWSTVLLGGSSWPAFRRAGSPGAASRHWGTGEYWCPGPPFSSHPPHQTAVGGYGISYWNTKLLEIFCCEFVTLLCDLICQHIEAPEP